MLSNAVRNTGRKAKNSYDIVLFTKGNPRNLGKFGYRTNGMLPVCFTSNGIFNNCKICKSQKPANRILKRIEWRM